MGLHRGALAALLVFLCLVHGGREAEAAGGGGFVRAQGTHFVLNGSPYYANGFNAYWLMTMASDPAQRGKVTSALSQAASRGLTVARTWAFSDGGGNALQYSPGKYNENTFKGLDFVLSEARKVGVKVILSLVNNYDTFGGKKQYVDWARGQGQAIGSDDDFFTNTLVKVYYKNHVKTVLSRVNTVTGVAYKDDPTILAWELMNEPRCQSDLSGRSIQSWITEMAAHVKSIDANHMLEAGLEGFYGASSSSSSSRGGAVAVNPSGYLVGTDFIANNQVPGIDFATVHSYPDQWLSSSSSEPPTTRRSCASWAGGWTRTSRTRTARCGSRCWSPSSASRRGTPGTAAPSGTRSSAWCTPRSTSRRGRAGRPWAGSSGSSWPTAWTPTGTATRSSSRRRPPPQPPSSRRRAGSSRCLARRWRGGRAPKVATSQLKTSSSSSRSKSACVS